jgi:hypothetical protein
MTCAPGDRTSPGPPSIDSTGDGHCWRPSTGSARRPLRPSSGRGARRAWLGHPARWLWHTGEIEIAGDNIRGLAVHVGARVGALASAGEVLVSSTVKDLTAGSGLQFEDAGEHELKGVPDQWHLYRVLN